jgi:C-terminal processing protease CtpA/Prc
MDMGDVANAIRGELGSSVTLLVRRAGGTEPEKVVLERARVNMPDRNHRGRRAPHPLPNR